MPMYGAPTAPAVKYSSRALSIIDRVTECNPHLSWVKCEHTPHPQNTLVPVLYLPSQIVGTRFNVHSLPSPATSPRNPKYGQ